MKETSINFIYGIDEYILSSFFNINDIKKQMIYFRDTFISDIDFMNIIDCGGSGRGGSNCYSGTGSISTGGSISGGGQRAKTLMKQINERKAEYDNLQKTLNYMRQRKQEGEALKDAGIIERYTKELEDAQPRLIAIEKDIKRLEEEYKRDEEEDAINKYDILKTVSVLIYKVLADNNTNNTDFTYFTFIEQIEKLRNMSDVNFNNFFSKLKLKPKQINLIKLCISILPTKYSLQSTIFLQEATNQIITKKIIYKNIIDTYSEILKLFENNIEKLIEDYYLYCSMVLFTNSVDIIPNIGMLEKYKTVENCNEIFYSGFYNVTQPVLLRNAFIRRPDDIKEVINFINTNKLVNKLQGSDYKVSIEKDEKVIGNLNKELSEDDTNKIITYLGLDSSLLSITNEKERKVFIWTFLNLLYYDIDPNNLVLGSSPEELKRKEKINTSVIKLVKMQEFIDKGKAIVNYLSQNPRTGDIATATPVKYEDYKMSTYEQKYFKYKQKYLVLKNSN
jgi:hypothetical protein